MLFSRLTIPQRAKFVQSETTFGIYLINFQLATFAKGAVFLGSDTVNNDHVFYV
jgi:hypothetical protein